jgi:RNA polymerase-binding protein DksA
MEQHELEYFKNLILEKHEEILDELENGEFKELRSESSEKSYAFHMADMGSDNNEREKSFMVASLEGDILAELDDALTRIENGSYGICEVCSSEINRNRLEAIPYAKLCLDCKSQFESY